MRGLWLLMAFGLGACAAGRARPWRAGGDDLSLSALAEAIVAELPRLPAVLRFGERAVTREAYRAALLRFAEVARSGDARRVAAVVDELFEPWDAGDHLVTSYYEPTIDGARAPTARWSQAVYALPPDGTHATRHDIDAAGALAGRGLELCWVDPVDALVLHIEGSGVVRLDDGSTLPLDYAGHNGQPYVSLARPLKALVPQAAFTGMHAFEAYLRALSPGALRAILDQNPRYVFFRARTAAHARASLGVEVTDGRTIATDRARPKGALAYLLTTQPRFVGDGVVPAGFVPLGRFVLDQDTGSAIVGQRIDLYWGEGAEARRTAGVMKQRGRLVYLVPRAR